MATTSTRRNAAEGGKRPASTFWDRLFSLTVLAGMVLIGFGVCTPAAAQEYVPRIARAKIDKVDVSEAPRIRIHSTFLDGRTVPVSPDKVKAAYIACNGEEIGQTADIKTFGDLSEPMDIAIILPVSRRFPEEVQEMMKEGVSSIIGAAREGDQIAAFVDDGEGIAKSGLGAPDAAAAAVSDAVPKGNGAFTYSALEYAIDAMVEASDEDRRQAIVMVTDGFDTDPDLLQPSNVKTKLMSLYQRAKDEGILIYVVMYQPIIRDLIPYYEGMSRKTKATYRQATTAEGVLRNVKYAFGEIYGQLVVDYDWEDVEEGRSCEFSVAFEREFGRTVGTRPFSPVDIEEVAYDWWGLAIIVAIIVGALILLLIIFLVVRKILKKRKAKKAAAQDEELQEKIDAGELCPTCHRTMMPDWDECLFCAMDEEQASDAAGAAAGGAAAAGGGAKTKKKQKQKKTGKKKADKKKAPAKATAPADARVCDQCGRTLMPNWTECMFCAAGIGGGGAAAGGGGGGGMGMAAGAAGGMGMMAAGGGGGGGSGGGGAGSGGAGGSGGGDAPRDCPTCKRTLKPHWEECLYCAAGI